MNLSIFDGMRVLITGGTGSFGNAFVKHVLETGRPESLIVFSRDEMKQWEMAQRFGDEKSLRFFIGDVRDRDRLLRAFENVDIVVHAAATKIVPTAEYNPFEAIKTNVHGAMNVVDAALDRKVARVVALSTDKASSPINLYGATKLVSDKLFTAASAYAGSKSTKFCVVRYGNVLGSRGSVVPFFYDLRRRGEPLRITDASMTRFMITLDEGVKLVETALSSTMGGEIFVKKIPSMNILDIAEAVDPGGSREFFGVRPGEKIHEQMIGVEDSPFTLEFDDHFRILPQVSPAALGETLNQGGRPVSEGFCYSSDKNQNWMTISELQGWMRTAGYE